MMLQLHEYGERRGSFTCRISFSLIINYLQTCLQLASNHDATCIKLRCNLRQNA